MSQDTFYRSYPSDPLTADAFLQPPPSPYASSDPDVLLSLFEDLPPYGFEDPVLAQDQIFPEQDSYNFHSDPYSFNMDQELLWRQFEDPPFLDAEFNFHSFTSPGYPTESYTQENPSQVSNTGLSTPSSSQNSISPDFSPQSTSESQGEVTVAEKAGKKRRNTGQTDYSESTPQVLRKRARGQVSSQPVSRKLNYVDRGYESMSPQTTLSSPRSDIGFGNASKQKKGTEVVGNMARAIDGMIDKFSQSQVNLTKEEIEALQTAGLPIPTTLPLTKVEQHALRDVRRKLKNKQAAMENRRRKKEYVSELEKKVADFEKMVSSLEERMNRVEKENQALETELKRLKRAGKREKENRPVSVQTGACLMVFILCFGLVFGTWLTGVGPSLAVKNMNGPLYSQIPTFTSRTLKGNLVSSCQTNLKWLTDILFQTGAEFLSLFNFTSDTTYFLINQDSLLCQNDSCAPH